MTALRRRRGGNAILVYEVAPGSAAAKAGVRPGQQLLAISDPIREREVWDLNGLASLKVRSASVMISSHTAQPRGVASDPSALLPMALLQLRTPNTPLVAHPRMP